MFSNLGADARASSPPPPDPAWAGGAQDIRTPLSPRIELVELVVHGAAGAHAPVPAAVERAVAGIGGRLVGARSGSVLLVEVPAGTAGHLEIAGVAVREPVHMNVPLGEYEAAPAYGAIPGDSAAAIGASDFHAAGYRGTGVRIGVIDFFNMTFWNDAEMGPRPTAANGRAMCRYESTDCTADYNVTALAPDPRQHGPAVVEVIRDVAPGADIFIASAETYSDYVEVLDWFAANGVSIISRSLGTYLDGPGDGRGPTAELADYAVSKGMVWLNATGNGADGGYWRGPSQRYDGYVKFAGTDASSWMPVNRCTVAALRWNDWDTQASQRSDYDFEVYEVDATTGAAMPLYSRWATGIQAAGEPPLEQLPATCPAAGKRLFLRVRYRGGGTPADDVLEILDYQNGLHYHQAPHSAALPAADSANPSVLAIGAVEPVGTTTIAAYSSQGPTNDGRIKPDLVAPSAVRSSVYGTFHGTSASTPAVAGAAALLLQSGVAAPGQPLAAMLRSSVVPLGSPVPNSVSGAGLLRMPPVPSGQAAPEPLLPSATAYHPLPEPQRIVDTRPTSAIGPSALTGRRDPGTMLDVPVESLLGRAAGSVAAVALNLTVIDATTPGWAQVVPTQRATVGAYSNLNLDAVGQTRSNVVQVPVGANGSVSVYIGAGGFTLIDVLGTYEHDGAEATAGRFSALDPTRVLDTRAGGSVGVSGTGPGGALRRGEIACIDTSAAGIDTSGTAISALVLNITASDVSAGGYVQALPTGGARGTTSTLNLVPGATAANTTIVPLGGPCGGSPRSASVLFDAGDAGASAQLIVDVTGYITGGGAAQSGAGLFVPLTPGRVLDTRPTVLASGATHTAQVGGAAGPAPAVPAGATGVAANFTATSTTGWGYLTAWPAGAALPATSSLNWSSAGSTVANGAIVKLAANGALDLRSVTPGQSLSAAHLLDVFGYYT